MECSFQVKREVCAGVCMIGRTPHLYMRVRRSTAAISTVAPMPRPICAFTGNADGTGSASYWTGPRVRRRLPICTWWGARLLSVGCQCSIWPSIFAPRAQPYHKLWQCAGAIGRLWNPWGWLTVQMGECECLHQALAVTNVHAHLLLADPQVEALTLGDRPGA